MTPHNLTAVALFEVHEAETAQDDQHEADQQGPLGVPRHPVSESVEDIVGGFVSLRVEPWPPRATLDGTCRSVRACCSHDKTCTRREGESRSMLINTVHYYCSSHDTSREFITVGGVGALWRHLLRHRITSTRDNT